jgi:lysine-N-methylase
MKLRAPKYYLDFACIADRCKHSCCIGWEIDVDADTMAKYSALRGGYGEEMKKSICGDPPHFALREGDRCPHLDERGLCRIICEFGDGYLCDICREHPRFYNSTARGREAGLGISCEEACRIVLSSDNYTEMIEIGEDGEENDISFDSVAERESIFGILSDRSVSYGERLKNIAKKYDLTLSDIEWRDIINDLEYLDESHRELFSGYSSKTETPDELEPELERALAYFIYRHASAAENEDEFRAALGFSLFCERLLASIASKETILDCARILSEEIEYSEDNTDAIKTEFLF